MPQLILEYSSNVIEKNNLFNLLKKFNETLTQLLTTELLSCKSRAVEQVVYCIGDGNINNAFVHITLKVMPGRTFDKLKNVGEVMMDILKEYFHESSQKLNLQLSLEIDELKKTYFKYH
jgi:5-carboxymethyl-2-hydroxymuconate isomerase